MIWFLVSRMLVVEENFKKENRGKRKRETNMNLGIIMLVFRKVEREAGSRGFPERSKASRLVNEAISCKIDDQ